MALKKDVIKIPSSAKTLSELFPKKGIVKKKTSRYLVLIYS